jgi:hypothetical protein
MPLSGNFPLGGRYFPANRLITYGSREKTAKGRFFPASPIARRYSRPDIRLFSRKPVIFFTFFALFSLTRRKKAWSNYYVVNTYMMILGLRLFTPAARRAVSSSRVPSSLFIANPFTPPPPPLIQRRYGINTTI